jgi:hypothetical protein
MGGDPLDALRLPIVPSSRGRSSPPGSCGGSRRARSRASDTPPRFATSSTTSTRRSCSTPDLAATVEKVRNEEVHFRNDTVTGVGGKQIMVEDPSGNAVELFEPTRAEARLDRD